MEQKARRSGGVRVQKTEPVLASRPTQAFGPETQARRDGVVRIVPLGGLGEVGRNMMVVEYEGKIIIIDMGFRMPEEDMPGIDYIIPNAAYLKGKEQSMMNGGEAAVYFPGQVSKIMMEKPFKITSTERKNYFFSQ